MKEVISNSINNIPEQTTKVMPEECCGNCRYRKNGVFHNDLKNNNKEVMDCCKKSYTPPHERKWIKDLNDWCGDWGPESHEMSKQEVLSELLKQMSRSGPTEVTSKKGEVVGVVTMFHNVEVTNMRTGITKEPSVTVHILSEDDSKQYTLTAFCKIFNIQKEKP